MSVTLPSTLVELRRLIMAGVLDTATALQLQKDAIRGDSWNSVVTTFNLDDGLHKNTQALTGVGLAHKDIFVVPGHKPMCGASKAPGFDASVSPLIQRLGAAGSQVLAMLTMAEFASGVTGENANHPLPLNPLGKRYAVGGSSSGSAVAVAAGLCYGSLGTDTAGSVRIPAASCGVFALKPSDGVLETQGCFPLAPSLDTVGIITRSALDAAVLFAVSMESEVCKKVLPSFVDVIHDQGGVADSTYLPRRPWRIATVFGHSNVQFSAAPEVRAAIANMAIELTDGVVVQHEQIQAMPILTKNASTVLHVEAAVTHLGRLQSDTSGLSAITRSVAVPGAVIPALWYRKAIQDRETLRQQFLDNYFSSSDILLTPILPKGIPDWEQVRTDAPSFTPSALLALFSWTAFVNYLGLPAVVFPVGYDQYGMPICVQAIGRPYSEATLLAFAYQIELHFFGTSGFVKRLPLLDPALS